MGLSRSTFYDVAFTSLDPREILARIGVICDEFECYGYRRVGAALRHQGVVVNSKSFAFSGTLELTSVVQTLNMPLSPICSQSRLSRGVRPRQNRVRPFAASLPRWQDA